MCIPPISRLILLFISIQIFTSACLAQPVINSFAPLSGPAGTNVTITGTNFSNLPGGNVVYFGPVRAVVSVASPTSLTVVVPAAAGYQPITVTSNNLTAYSNQPFVVTFPAGGRLVQGSFDVRQDFAIEGQIFETTVIDLDGDNKPDIVSLKSNGDNNRVAVLRNNSTTGNFSFDQQVDFITDYSPSDVATGDIDGDGKPDVITANRAGTISILRNTSTPGSISFAPKVDSMTGGQYYRIAMGDIDNDGKPDIVLSGAEGNKISVFRNTSVPGSVSFAAKLFITVGVAPVDIVMGDIDGDGRSDLAIADEITYTISVLRNTSSQGLISFAASINLVSGNNTEYSIALGDMDADGKSEICVSNYNLNSISVFQNTSSPGNISFNTKLDFPSGNSPTDLSITDIDGDGRPDLTVLNYLTPSGISLLKNTSTATGISFEPNLFHPAATTPFALFVNDVDGDSKPDLTVIFDLAVALFRNKVNEPIINFFTPTTGMTGSTVNIKGINFTATTNVSFGGVAANSFTEISDSVITATIGTGATGKVSVTAQYGTGTLNEFGFNIPRIASFTPSSGIAGTSVIISGNYFSNNSTDNIVYFGATKATVISSSVTSLLVTAPHGTTYQPITVTVNNKTAYAPQPFTETFNYGGSIGSNSFGPKIDFATGSSARKVAVGDLNGDGKSDLVVTNYNANTISIFRNTSTGANISFAPKVDFDAAFTPTYIAVGDLNGDGKTDITLTNYSGGTITVYINTTTGNTFSFTKKQYNTGNFPMGIAIADLDADGKPEIVTANAGAASFSVFKNVSVNGVSSFAPRQSFASGVGPGGITSGDLDGDGKPEIVISSRGGNGIVYVYRNMCISGQIDFASAVELSGPVDGYNIVASDLDNDGKSDLAVGNYSGAGALFRNVSTNGTLVFEPKVDFNTGAGCIYIALGDIDGDSKPDIATANYNANNISVLKNTSTPGILSFATKYDYTTGLNPYGVAIGDINNDGKPELFCGNSGSGNFSIFKNKIGDSILVELCPPAASTPLTSDLTGTNYQWQEDTGNGFNNISDNSNYTGTNSLVLQLTNIPSSWHSYKYRCLVNGSYSIIFSLRFVNIWTGIAGSAWENPANWSCGVAPDSNTDVIINSGSVTLNSSITIRTLTLAPGVVFTVSPGVVLTITH